MRQFTKIFLLALIAICYGCSKESSKTDQVGQAPLLKTKWELKSIINNSTGIKTNIPSGIGSEFIEFIDSSGVIGVTTCANECTGYYKLFKTDSIKITGFGCTTIAAVDTNCSNWERYLLVSLESSHGYSLEGKSLILTSSDKYNLVFDAHY